MAETTSDATVTHAVEPSAEDDVDSEMTSVPSLPASEAPSSIQSPPQSAPAKPSRPPRSGYFLFAKEKRAELASQGHLGQKVGETAKQIGALWSALTSDEKKAYNDRVTALREAYEQSREPGDGDDDGNNADNHQKSEPLQFPLGRIKKIVMLDESVKRVSKEATLVITRAVEGFVKEMSEEMAKHAKNQGRKTVQIRDFGSVLHSRRKYRFLHHVFPPDNSMDHRKRVSKRNRASKKSADVNGSSSSSTSTSTKDASARNAESQASISTFFKNSSKPTIADDTTNEESVMKNASSEKYSRNNDNVGDDDLFGGAQRTSAMQQCDSSMQSSANNEPLVSSEQPNSSLMDVDGGADEKSVNHIKRRKLNNGDDSSMMMMRMHMDDSSLMMAADTSAMDAPSALDTTRDLLMFGEQTEDSDLGLNLKNHSVDIEDLA